MIVSVLPSLPIVSSKGNDDRDLRYLVPLALRPSMIPQTTGLLCLYTLGLHLVSSILRSNCRSALYRCPIRYCWELWIAIHRTDHVPHRAPPTGRRSRMHPHRRLGWGRLRRRFRCDDNRSSLLLRQLVEPSTDPSEPHAVVGPAGERFLP